MLFNPHKLGVHKVLQHIPLNAIFDAPYKRAVKKAVNIADLRLIAKSRAHKVSLRVVAPNHSVSMPYDH
jgi:L-lactate dehydrogenase (cytochrome)